MAIEKVSSHLRDIAKLINDNINGRTLVVWGDRNIKFENYLYNEYKLKVAFSVFRQISLCNGDSIRHIKSIYGKSNQYYVINLNLPMNEENGAILCENGYEATRDFLLCGIVATIVPKNCTGYRDANNNYCEYCPPNCTIRFNGKNAKVLISKEILIKERITINVGCDSEVIIKGRSILKAGDIIAQNNAKIIFNHVYYSNITMVSVADNAILAVDENTSILGARLNVYAGHEVYIGKDCMFSQNIALFAGDGHSIFDTRTGKRKNFAPDMPAAKKRTIIGDHVWCGYGVTILGGGTKIGDGAIIGAGSVVKGNFPNNCIIAGNLAKVVKKDIAWSRDISDTDIKQCGENYILKTSEEEL